jgi:hypothetical protein
MLAHMKAMAAYDFDSDEFDWAAFHAGHSAFLETLAMAASVFYLDSDGLKVKTKLSAS